MAWHRFLLGLSFIFANSFFVGARRFDPDATAGSSCHVSAHAQLRQLLHTAAHAQPGAVLLDDRVEPLEHGLVLAIEHVRHDDEADLGAADVHVRVVEPALLARTVPASRGARGCASSSAQG